jgi:hypothetical protein
VSNVLIGIIGVILFIGLALAGALFLGPRFQESTLNSKASATIQRVSQLGHATNLYEVQEGVKFMPSTGMPWQAMVPGYIKALPKDVTGTIDLNWNETIPTPITYTVLGGTVEEARSLCKAIVKQTQSLDAVPARTWNKTTMTVPSNAGCISINDDTMFVAYSRY